MGAEKRVMDEQVADPKCASESDPVGNGAADMATDAREQRILQYHDASLRADGALVANLGALIADLLLVAYGLRRMLAPALKMATASPEEFNHLLPAVDRYLRLTGQVGRFSALLTRLGTPAQTDVVADTIGGALEGLEDRGPAR